MKSYRNAMTVCFVASVLAGAAQASTGNQLLKICTEQRQMCVAYVSGVVGGLESARADLAFRLFFQRNVDISDMRPSFCLPANNTWEQLADVTRLWLQQHPELRHELAANCVRSALADAFPCR